MKFTLSWLKEHLDTSASLEEISIKLTSIGLEVEDITDAGAALADFTVAEIIEANPHPDADKLRVCRVNSSAGELQIVCGAPNARAGIKVALAQVGALIPNGGFKIKQSKIRGVESCGMMCSSRELNLGDDHAGIIELPLDAAIGTPIADVLGLNDPVIEIAITPNRGDCLGVYGVARDLAAAGLGVLKPFVFATGAGQMQEYQPSHDWKVDGELDLFLKTDTCREFTATVIRGVKNAPSPDWLKARLEAIGLRSISTLVDITNYFTFTYGRPLHVYDADKIKGNIVVREALEGEVIEGLNDKSYTLKGGECVIADELAALGLGGIVGGVPSSVTDETTNVILECAWFEPVAIAMTARAHQINTDAAYRFERTVDPDFVTTGAEMAAQMILALCGGTIIEAVNAGEAPDPDVVIPFDAKRVMRQSGLEISEKDQIAILEGLRFRVTGNQVHVPSWRPDCRIPSDLTEEILRIYGYDNIPSVSLPKPASTPPAALSDTQKRRQVIKRQLAMMGLAETCHYAFMASAQAVHFAQVHDELKLMNPISAELDVMRPTLLAHLMSSAGNNHARGHAGVALFECGGVYTPKGQRSVVATLRSGRKALPHWKAGKASYDWTDAKADALAILEAAGMDTQKVQISRGAPEYYHPGQSGVISLGPKKILGYFGTLHPLTCEAMDVPAAMVACEIFTDEVPPQKTKAPKALEVSDLQPVSRDFAFLLPADKAAGDLLAAIRKSHDLITDAWLFDVYRGEHVQEGFVSLALGIQIQPVESTLTDADIEAISTAVIKAAESKGGSLRG